MGHTFRWSVAAFFVAFLWMILRMSYVGSLVSLDAPVPPLPFSVFGNVGFDLYPITDLLLVLLFPLAIVGIRKGFLRAGEKYDGWDVSPSSDLDFDEGFIFGIAGATVMSVLAKWVIGYFFAEYHADLFGFIVIPAAFSIIYVAIEDGTAKRIGAKGKTARVVPLMVPMTFAVSFLVGFFSTVLFVSAMFRGWVFPWILIAVWLFKEFALSRFKELAGKTFGNSGRGNGTRPPRIRMA